MLISMTGFASKIVTIPLETGEQTTFTINIKSLNSRFFETTFKLPYVLSNLETDFTQLFKTKLKRGHIFCTITLSSTQLFKGAVEPSMEIIKGYADAILKVQKKFPIEGALSVSDLIQLPNVFSIEEKGIDEKLKARIIQETDKVVDTLLETRRVEGLALQKDMDQRCVLMQQEIEKIEQVSEATMAQRKAEVSKGIQELGNALDEATEAQRVMLYNELNKIDIHEEIVRFKSHLKSIKSLLASPDMEKGKRIDFTLQELGREINTIAAKCSDATISALAINIKVEIEKIREQAQNIV